ncbi:MAG: nucleotidyltransferase family protein [Verrucomicrobia bacterium]|nr:nucleotidyltransferase family protein [Verrucomicrobiota bacterium]
MSSFAHEVTHAMILAAGRGTRMLHLTEDLPKPMIAVRGRPILETIIRGLQENGVRHVLVVVGYRKEVIMDHFGDGRDFGLDISYVVQEVQNGTGKVVELGRPFTGDHPFVLSYGDILVPASSYAPLVRLEGDDARIAVKVNQDVSKGGAVFLNEEGLMTDLIEKGAPGQPTSPYYNAGIYTFSPVIHDYVSRLRLSPRGEYELTDAIREMAYDGLSVRGVELQGEWADVRDPGIVHDLNQTQTTA